MNQQQPEDSYSAPVPQTASRDDVPKNNAEIDPESLKRVGISDTISEDMSGDYRNKILNRMRQKMWDSREIRLRIRSSAADCLSLKDRPGASQRLSSRHNILQAENSSTFAKMGQPPEEPYARKRKKHEEYKNMRDEDLAFLSNRAVFFLHDYWSSGPAANGFRQFERKEGRGKVGQIQWRYTSASGVQIHMLGLTKDTGRS